jgi:transketolase
LRRGAYILADAPKGKPAIILIATGSEVGLIVAAKKKLDAKKIAVRIVSMPSWELFLEQSQKYRDSILPPAITARLAVEAGISQGWDRFVGQHGDVIGIDDGFGASAPGPLVMKKYGFTVENVCKRAVALLKNKTRKS